MNPEDFTIEYCPYCDHDVPIRSEGVTACPVCGKPLVPCSLCEFVRECNYSICPYECNEQGDEFIEITNPPMTEEEINFAWETSVL